MSARNWEFIATDEPAVIAEPFLDAMIVEDGERDGSFPDSPWADECDGFEVFCETDDLLDQPVTPETGPRWSRRQFTKGNAEQCKTVNP